MAEEIDAEGDSPAHIAQNEYVRVTQIKFAENRQSFLPAAAIGYSIVARTSVGHRYRVTSF
ncbi:hypothetical protein [Paracoccus homiensis]|uniref:hypothetical protein n=1 Tax=Paracoccus homiensis TaxID=364199 RepID=UPI00398D366E